MKRRNLIGLAVGTVLLASCPGLASAEPVTGLVLDRAELVDKLEAVRIAAFECVSAGEACLRHCELQIADGHGAEFARCNVAAQQMRAVCQAMGTLAAQRSHLLPGLLGVCIDACDTCRVECKKHEGHFAMGMHLECKTCMESCQRCLDACKTLRTAIG